MFVSVVVLMCCLCCFVALRVGALFRGGVAVLLFVGVIACLFVCWCVIPRVCLIWCVDVLLRCCYVVICVCRVVGCCCVVVLVCCGVVFGVLLFRLCVCFRVCFFLGIVCLFV